MNVTVAGKACQVHPVELQEVVEVPEPVQLPSVQNLQGAVVCEFDALAEIEQQVRVGKPEVPPTA